MSAPALELRGVRMRLGEREVLRGVHLAVGVREHVLLVGASGSGKTTILRLAAGLIAPDAGEVLLGGTLVSSPGRVLVPPERRGIGYLFQGGALWPHLSVEGTLHFVLRAARVPKAQWEARVAELLELLDLQGFERRKPMSLSGGEAQRLALARALAPRPALLLLDEPLGPLDQELRGALLARLGDLQRRLGFAALHVTHDPREAAAIADQSLKLEAGQIARVLLPQEEAAS